MPRDPRRHAPPPPAPSGLPEPSHPSSLDAPDAPDAPDRLGASHFVRAPFPEWLVEQRDLARAVRDGRLPPSATDIEQPALHADGQLAFFTVLLQTLGPTPTHRWAAAAHTRIQRLRVPRAGDSAARDADLDRLTATVPAGLSEADTREFLGGVLAATVRVESAACQAVLGRPLPPIHRDRALTAAFGERRVARVRHQAPHLGPRDLSVLAVAGARPQVRDAGGAPAAASATPSDPARSTVRRGPLHLV